MVLSLISWQEQVNILPIAINATALPPPSNSTAPPSAALVEVRVAAIHPNAAVLQWMLLFQLIFPLCIYALFLCICIKKSFKIPRVVLVTVGITIAWSVIVCVLIRVYNVAFWWVEWVGGPEWMDC